MQLSDLLWGKPLEKFTGDQLMGKAHWRWDRDQHYAAFLLFDAAHERPQQVGKRKTARAAKNRAAVTLFLSGESTDEAVARLDEVLSWYEGHTQSSIDDDSHFAEWAASCLLEDVFRSRPDRFSATFDTLCQRCGRAGLTEFPSIHPQQDRLANFAHQLGAKDVMRRLLPKLKQRSPMPRKLKQSISNWEAWLDS